MPPSFKIVVSGPFNAGKTRFIQTISEIDVVTTERRITRREKGMKAETTVAMDYGRVTLDGVRYHLHGTPGQARFDFMWEILTREMNGLVLVVDATDAGSFADGRELIDLFTSAQAVPYVVAANKQDLDGAVSPLKIRRALGLDPQILVMPCVASRKTSVKQVLSQLAALL